jgi:hypothetical protein
VIPENEWVDPDEVADLLDSLPEATKVPCNECPWVRTSAPGWLGPYTAREWVALAQSDSPIACHTTITEDGQWDTPGIRQCKGAAIYRANVLKSPRHPNVARAQADTETVFTWGEFEAHHERNGNA